MPAKYLVSRRDLFKLSFASSIAFVAGFPRETAAAEKLIGPEPTMRPQYARERFLQSNNCAQAIMETYAPSMGMSIKDARRVSAAFARGMGMGSECGAVTGAFMVIGMKYGKTRDDDSRADSETFKRMDRLVEEFRQRHEHIDCSSLLETDMSSKTGIIMASLKGHFKKRCPRFVESAAEILEEVLV